MLSFLFWNLNGKSIQQLVASIAQDNFIDVVILAECSITYAELLEAMNEGQSIKYELTFSPSPRLVLLSRLPHKSIKPVYDSGDVSIRRIFPPVGNDIILVAVHLASKLYQDTRDQALASTRLARLIDDTEQKIGHTRTVLVGDFNMNPFEDGVSGAEAIHGVMSKAVAKKETRVVGGQVRRFFYNPMWGKLGDTPPDPPGTYFYNSSRQINYFWNMFDQVLLRPELLPSFSDNDVKILTSAGTKSLLTAGGIPNASIASDHLPLTFSLSL
jgi:hypothetical protein